MHDHIDPRSTQQTYHMPITVLLLRHQEVGTKLAGPVSSSVFLPSVVRAAELMTIVTAFALNTICS